MFINYEIIKIINQLNSVDTIEYLFVALVHRDIKKQQQQQQQQQ